MISAAFTQVSSTRPPTWSSPTPAMAPSSLSPSNSATPAPTISIYRACRSPCNTTTLLLSMWITPTITMLLILAPLSSRIFRTWPAKVASSPGEGENCPDGKRDINGDPQDGCECAPTPNQGNTCFHPNANTGCDANGYCVFDSCLEGWHNLDGDLANGCEYQ